MSLWIYGWLGKEISETSLPEKEDTYSHLNMEDITDAEFGHIKRLCKDLKIKSLGEYRDLYVQSYTLSLADVFGKFQNMFLQIYGLDPARFFVAPGLTWQAALKKTKSNQIF